MRNLKLILVLTIGFFPVWLVAKQVSPETAQQVAKAQIQSRNQLRSAQELNLVFVKTSVNKTVNAPAQASGNASEDILYYVFNTGNKGFVVVSGDDIAKPVLGYSDTGTYDPDNLSPNFVYYLGFLANEIKAAIVQAIPQDEETKAQWEAYLTGNVAALRASDSEQAVAPLLDKEGIKWGQDTPYNTMCPTDNNGVATVTGCVATAMAQIMRYYKYPSQGKGIISNYTTTTSGLSVSGKNLANSIYDWDNMLARYSGVSYTAAQRDAVATLMYDCGISITTDFCTMAKGGSGASIWNAGTAFYTNFSYSQSIVHKERSFYSDTEWNAILKAQIDKKYPVLYGGQDQDNGGHAFVCDGYDDTGNFHFNWGWNGASNDGYFSTSAINPPNTQYNFDTDQEILVNIINGSGGTQSSEIVLDSAVDSNGKTLDMTLTSDKTQVTYDETINVTALYFLNFGYFSVTGYMGLALYDKNNQFVCSLGKYPSLSTFKPGEGSGISGTTSVPSSVPPGNYLIKPVWVTTSSDIIPVRVNNSVELPLTVVGNTALEPVIPTESIAEKVNVSELNGTIQIVAGATNPIKEVAVYSLQGALMYEANDVNSITHTINRNWSRGVYIVKVVSEKNTDNVKLIIR